MPKTSHISMGTHVRRLTNYIQSINMSEDDRVSSHKHNNTTKSFHLHKIPNMDKNLATIIVFDNCNKAYNELRLQQRSVGAVHEHDVPKQQAPLLRYLATLLATKAQACWWSKHWCCGTTTSLYIQNKKNTRKNH